MYAETDAGLRHGIAVTILDLERTGRVDHREGAISSIGSRPRPGDRTGADLTIVRDKLGHISGGARGIAAADQEMACTVFRQQPNDAAAERAGAADDQDRLHPAQESLGEGGIRHGAVIVPAEPAITMLGDQIVEPVAPGERHDS